VEAANKISFGYDSLDEAFPAVEPGVQPFGSRVLVQIRKPKNRTKGGLILTSETKDTELWNTQVAKVIAVGPLAFHNRDKMTPWPEGAWCEPGDYVRCPKYGGDKWTVKVDEDTEILFVTFDDLNLIGKVSDPLAMKAFL
jgi:co-chaperonin GroES (HSP10)